MYYLVFSKKNKGDKGPYPVSKMIKAYANTYGKNDICISLPGYMSTTEKNITKFGYDLSISRNLYFTEGMNGLRIVTDNRNFTIQELNNLNFKFNCKFKVKSKGKDHSKMIFFLDEKSRKDNLLIKAVLIGSSNQSYSTYFENSGFGESDILIIDSEKVFENSCFDSDYYDSRILNMFEEIENYLDNIIITKQISKYNKNLLIKMFNDCFEVY